MKIIIVNAMWCPACISMHKIWTSIEKKYSDIEFIKYDFDLDSEIVKDFSVGDILPVMIFMINDKEVERLIGEKTEEEISLIIDKYK